MKRALAIILTALSLACSIFRPKPVPYPEGVVFPVSEAGRVELKGRVIRSLVKTGDKLYLSTEKGVLYCLDGHGRGVEWMYDAQSALGCPPAVGPRVIAVWDVANNVHGLSLEGALIWKTQLPATASSDLCQAQDRLYVGTREGFLCALSQSTGEVLWTFKTGGAVEASAVAWYESVVLASTDGLVYFVGPDGKLRHSWEAGAPIRVTPLADGGRLYFGAEDASFNCLDLQSRRREWRLQAEGKILSPPRSDGSRVYFTASNTVLYAVKKKSGEIDWWKILPSRSPYSPEIAADQVLAAAASPVLLGLERRTGKEEGRYDAGSELRSSPSWSPPDILIALYDFASEKGSLARLQKLVKVELSASITQKVTVGTEVVFTASTIGFHLPKYEFTIRRDDKTAVAQEASARSSWTWFPEKPGTVTIGVRVRDARETRESEMSIEVTESK